MFQQALLYACIVAGVTIALVSAVVVAGEEGAVSLDWVDWGRALFSYGLWWLGVAYGWWWRGRREKRKG